MTPEQALMPILVVDDDHDLRDVVTALLADEGYQVVSQAQDGVEALSILLQLSPAPTVVLSDYRMPRMDGLRLLQALTSGSHELGRHRFILMTATVSHLSPAQRLLLVQHGVAVLRKPFERDRLLETVGEAVGHLGQLAAVTADAVAPRLRSRGRRPR